MTTYSKSRDFVRDFDRFRDIAASGGTVVISDGRGRQFSFRSLENTKFSLGDRLSDLCGIFQTKVRRKSLKSFGLKQ